MNSLLAPLRQIARDLVEKKLWPIAVLLLIAIVAVPVMIGGSSSSDAPAPEPVATTAPVTLGGAGTKSLITVSDKAVTGKDDRPGKIADPFYDPPDPPPPATSSDPGAAAGGAASPAPSGGGETTTETPTNRIDTRKTIDVKFGTAGNMRRIPRLKSGTDLPAGEDGVIRYAGVVAETRLARFVAVNKTLGKTDGDAKCYKKNDTCFALDMKAGDRQIFIVGGVRYTIEILSVPQGGAGNADTEDAVVSNSYYRTEVRFGEDIEQLDKPRAISRLTPLPGLIDPAAIYLGASDKGAVFLLGSGATATGEADCVDTECRIIVLGEGESTLIDHAPAEGEPRQFTLDVVTFDEVKTSAGVSKTMRARVHPDGTEVLSELREDSTAATAMKSVTYDADSGLVVASAAALKKVSK